MKWRCWAWIGISGISTGQNLPPPAANYPEACNRLAFASLYGLTQMTEGNIGFSPYNAHQMAAMLTEAARGATQAELLTLTQLPAESVERLRWITETRKLIPGSAADKSLVIETANSLWASPSHPFAPDFIRLVQAHFFAQTFDLVSVNPVQAAAQVNRWIRQRTRDRISSVVGPDSFDDSGAGLVLVNTIYLRSHWASQFEAGKTKMRHFQIPKGHQIPHLMMQQSGEFGYAEETDWQCLDLPLEAPGYSLRILLPRREGLRSDIESGLTSQVWRDLGGRTKREPVHVSLPRFAFTTELDLAPLWATFGAKRLFSRGHADLGGLSAEWPYHVTRVLHTTTIEVNETGATASAVTAVPAEPFADATPTAQPLPKYRVFNADHPFLWFIVHQSSHLILFAGRFAGKSDD